MLYLWGSMWMRQCNREGSETQLRICIAFFTPTLKYGAVEQACAMIETKEPIRVPACYV